MVVVATVIRRALPWRTSLLQRSQKEWLSASSSSRRIRLASSAAAEATAEHEEEDEGKGVGPSSLPRPKSLLYHDDRSATPDLDALDELNPWQGQGDSQGKGPGGRRKATKEPEKNIWDKAFASVHASFTVKQLQQLAKDADVPRRIMSQIARNMEAQKGAEIPKEASGVSVGRPAKGTVVATGKKTRLTKALLIHRFGLQDPYVVKPSASRARAAPLFKLEMTMPTHALFFFAADKQQRGRRLLQENQTILRPGRLLNKGQVQVILAGEEEQLEHVKELIQDFISSRITSKPALLTTIDGQEELSIESRHLRLISQLSSTFVETESDGHGLIIHSLSEQEHNLAQNLLAQVHQELLLSKRRQIYSLAAPPVPTGLGDSMPEYAFSHHVGSEEPLPLLARTTSDSISASLFRLTRQRGGGQAAGGALDDFMSEQEHAVLRMAGDRRTLISLDEGQPVDGSNNDNILDQLRASPAVQEEDGLEESFSIQFGHLLFDNVAGNKRHNSTDTNGEESAELPAQVPTRIQSLLRPPLPRAWPLQYALDRLPSSRVSKPLPDMLDNPNFVPCVPPVAHLLQPGYKRREDSYSPMETASSRKAQELLRQREWSLTMDRLRGAPAREQTLWEEEEEAREIERKSKFPDNVDEASCKVQDLVEVVYAPSDASTGSEQHVQELRLLVDVGHRHADAGKKAMWVKRREIDVIAPESSVDFRIEHESGCDALKGNESGDSTAGLHSKIHGIFDSIDAAYSSSDSLAPDFSPPVEVILEDKGKGRMLLVRTSRITRVSWDILDPVAAAAAKKAGHVAHPPQWRPRFVLDYTTGEGDNGSARREMRIEYKKASKIDKVEVRQAEVGTEKKSPSQETEDAVPNEETKEERTEVGEAETAAKAEVAGVQASNPEEPFTSGERRPELEVASKEGDIPVPNPAPRWQEVSKLLEPFLEKGYLTIPGTLR